MKVATGVQSSTCMHKGASTARSKPAPAPSLVLLRPSKPHSSEIHIQQTFGSNCAHLRWSTGGAQRPLITQAAEVSTSATATSPTLAELDLVPLLNTSGMIAPAFPEGTEASVFAIFDENRKLQYVGFSKDIRNSLRTVFSRRPDKTFFYKAVHFSKLDQKVMLGVRTQWFEEVGGPPSGNKLALERAAWEKPVDAGAISARGQLEAARSEAKAIQLLLKQRGCKEDFVPNPELMEKGQVDFMAADALTPEELERARKAVEDMASKTRTVSMIYNGEPATFELLFKNSYKTNGGYMFDVVVQFDDRETDHRVIAGKEFFEPLGLAPEQVVERTFAFLLGKKIARRTEGMLLSGQFPMNYFSISEVQQWYDEFADMFADTGRSLPGDDKYWRFNRLHDYGAKGKNEDSGAVDAAKSEHDYSKRLNQLTN